MLLFYLTDTDNLVLIILGHISLGPSVGGLEVKNNMGASLD